MKATVAPTTKTTIPLTTEATVVPGKYGLFAGGLSWGSRSPYEEEAVVRAYKVAADLLNGIHSEFYGKN